MAIARLGPRCRSCGVDAFADLVGRSRRRGMASPFCISRCIYFRCGALAYAAGNSGDPGPHACRGARRGRNGDATWDSRAGRRQFDPR